MLDELPFEADDAATPKNHRRKTGGRTALTLLLVFVLLATLGAGGWYGFDKVKGFFTAEDYAGDGNGKVVQVEVPEGAVIADIGNVLYNAGVVKSAQAFVEAAEENQKSQGIQPGQYRLEKEMSGAAAVKALVDPASRGSEKFAVPAGQAMWNTFKTLSASTGVPVDDFKKAAKDPAKLGVAAEWFKREDGKKTPKSVEGFLAPGSYKFDAGASASDMLSEMVSRFMDEADETSFVDKVDDLEFDISPYEALIVASLTQGEAASSKPDDFPKVARVAYNRLYGDFTCKDGVYNCLQFDSALNYGIVKAGGKHTDSGDLTAKQLKDKKNTYNTHVYDGLTPTPINSPGKDALNGAIKPTKGEWTFFVTVDKDGTTKFTDNQDDFDVLLNEACKNGVFDCDAVN